MFRKYVFNTVASVALLTSAAFVASGQTGELRGHANIKQADGQTTPASDAVIDVYRTDLPGRPRLAKSFITPAKGSQVTWDGLILGRPAPAG